MKQKYFQRIISITKGFSFIILFLKRENSKEKYYVCATKAPWWRKDEGKSDNVEHEIRANLPWNGSYKNKAQQASDGSLGILSIFSTLSTFRTLLSTISNVKNGLLRWFSYTDRPTNHRTSDRPTDGHPSYRFGWIHLKTAIVYINMEDKSQNTDREEIRELAKCDNCFSKIDLLFAKISVSER